MVVVKVELWPGGLEDQAEELSRMYIANTGSSPHPDIGNYNVALMRKGAKNPPWKIGFGGNDTTKPQREGSVENHPRKQHVMHLVRKALTSILGV